jgi:SAM-dependent methyltransferase
MSTPFAWAEPREVFDLEQCRFYHSLDLPGLAVIRGRWDLRGVVDDYLGRFDFAGKRALDVGAASGYLSFEMERRGAEVVSFDLEDGRCGDFVPYAGLSPTVEEERDRLAALNEATKNAYWLAHRTLGSRARAYYGDVYDLPTGLGGFDVVFYGMILGHLRDPLGALHSGARLCRETMIVTNQMFEADEPVAVVMASRENPEPASWWGLSVEAVRRMLSIVGFEVVGLYESRPRCQLRGRSGEESCHSLVAKRVAGAPDVGP